MTSSRRSRGFTPGLHGIRALATIDACNDFADFAGAIHKSAIPVPGGREIGPVIGALQKKGKESGFFHKQFDIRDSHKPEMFSFACNNKRNLKQGVNCVPDRDGVLHTILPKHMIPGTWGWELIPGVLAEYYDAYFRKGEELDKDQFSGATPEVIRWLQQQGVTDLYLTGLVYRICVGTSAINFVRAGFNVCIVKDATRDLDLPAWANVIEIMQKIGVREIESAELLAQMDR
ncbi:MAG: isochorismatase family protein [Candidatus Obscuribacterales bacterium]|nr:isochorismatase family protein [Candidatus Obscuribacterales bacterium]